MARRLELLPVKVPVITVAGTNGKGSVVAVAENTAVLEMRYRKLGGSIKVIHKPGVGHHPHSLKDPHRLLDFILKASARPKKSE